MSTLLHFFSSKGRKTNIRPLVGSLYGFENAKSAITHNRERAENLKDDYAFVYKVVTSL